MAKNNKLVAGIALLIVAILLISGVFVYFEYYAQKEETVKTKPVVVIDNRISPLETQGLILDVLRIRYRGSLDALMTPGVSWRNVPSFYFDAKIDEMDFTSASQKGGVASGGTVGSVFKTWDTITKEVKVMYAAKQEQPTSDITITLYEQQKSGLIIKRTKNIERDQFHVVYDYRTGHWTGDDYLKDSDGYGHFVGKTFEVWFNIYQTNADHDGIPYWMKVNVYHLDPTLDYSNYDPNHDGIPITWDWKWGYDPFAYDNHSQWDPDLDGLTNLEEYQMRDWFADPFSPDIYIEVDGMARGGLFDQTHIFNKIAQQALIERFCRHGINVYIDDGWPGDPINGGGEILPYVPIISEESGNYLSYYEHHFPKERRGIFRYVLFANRAGFEISSEFNAYDTIMVGTNLKLTITNKKAYTPRTDYMMEASYLMHELGHTCGIIHEVVGGCDNYSFMPALKNRKHYDQIWGNYDSVMNYYHILDKNLLDYSDGSHGENDFNDWENLYLPTFKMEFYLIEASNYSSSIEYGHAAAFFNLIKHSGWIYNETLTKQYVGNPNLKVFCINPNNVNLSIFVKADNTTHPIDRKVRVYTMPDVAVDAGWSLIYEGQLDAKGSIKFYSQQNEIDNVLELISESTTKK